MRQKHVKLLACNKCGQDLALEAAECIGDDVINGKLRCISCAKTWPIIDRIPVFVEGSNYAESFGWQWKRFHKLHRDSYNGTTIVRQTIMRRSGWRAEDLDGKVLLECGCGSGSDTEVLAQMAGTVVSADLSASVGVIPREVLDRENVLILRADLHNLPVKPAQFDIVYCHRVIQHTPDPKAAFARMARHVKKGGTFFLHSYDTHWKSILSYKYWLRPIIRPLPYKAVYRLLRLIGSVLYHVVGMLNRIAFMRRLVRLLIPFENYSRMLKKAGTTLDWRERYDYSFLVTFDALTPRHDHPSSPDEIEQWFQGNGFSSVTIRSRNPVIAMGVK